MRSITELVGTLKDVPSDRLVDLLREVHLGRRAVPGPAAVPASLRDAPPQRPGGGGTASTGDEDDGDTQRFFVDLEQRLTEQRSTAERLIERLRLRDRARRTEAPRPPAQQLLRLVALPGTLAGGRFLVVNPDDRDLRLDFRVGEARARDRPTVGCPAVSLAPAMLALAPGQRRVVRVEIELGATPFAAGDVVEIPIDALAAGRPVMKLWVEIEIDGEVRDGD